MTTMATELKAQLREQTGKGFSRQLRDQGFLPAVLYGHDIENKTIQVNERDMEKILRTKMGTNTFINLKVEGDKDYTVLIKDFQGHHISRKLTHMDFWHVKEDKEVEVNVTTRLEGKAPGLLLGGLMDHISHTIKLSCQADSIPAELVVDVNNLEINQTIHLADLTLPEGTKCREDYNPTIVSMMEEKAPVVEEEAPAEEEGAPAEEGKEGEGAKPEEKAAEGGDKGAEKGAEKGADKTADKTAEKGAKPKK